MEEDEKIVAPEVVENAEAQVDDDKELTTEVPTNEDRIDNIEGQIAEINKRFDGVITEQEKIVTVLDKISDKILSTEVTPKAEAAAANALKEGEVGTAVAPEAPEIGRASCRERV